MFPRSLVLTTDKINCFKKCIIEWESSLLLSLCDFIMYKDLISDFSQVISFFSKLFQSL